MSTNCGTTLRRRGDNKRGPWPVLVAALTLVLGISVAVYAQQRGTAGSSSTNVTGDMLRRAGTTDDAMPGAWLSYGRNQSETRFSTLKQIDSGNAKRLGLAWSYVMGAGGGNQELSLIHI